MAGALLRSSLPLLEKGIHPLQIIKGYKIALSESLEFLKKNCHQLVSNVGKNIEKIKFILLFYILFYFNY